MKKITFVAFGLLLTSNLWAFENVSATLELAPKASPGKPFTAIVRLKMAPGWHTYSDPSGDSGLPTKIKWTLPAGWSAGKIIWPKPKKLTQSGITDYVYENSVDLKVQITPPATIKEKKVRLKAKVDWLECRDVCQPGSAQLQGEILIAP